MKIQAALFAGITAMSCFVFLPVQAQDIQWVSGNPAFLRDATAIRLKYDYHGMLVGTTNEADYITYKKADFNKDEPGKGEKWLTGWIQDRSGRYEPAFERQLAKSLDRKTLSFISIGNDVKYTMVLKTTVTEPGWAGWGLFHKESHIDAVVTFVETAAPDTVLATISVKNSPGNGYDYDPAGRIENAYASCGKALGNFLRKKINSSSSGGRAEPSAGLASSDPGEIVRALKTMRSPEYSAAVPNILPLLNHENANVLRDACRTLAVIANKEVIPNIEPLLKDQRSAVRKDAQDAIDKLRAKP